MAGWNCSCVCASRGLITISAGFFLTPSRPARRRAKLIGGGAREFDIGAGPRGGCWLGTIMGLGLGGRTLQVPEPWLEALALRRFPLAREPELGLRRTGRAIVGGLAAVFRSSVRALADPVETIPATLPLRCSINSFCFCFTVSMDRTCSIAAGSSRMMLNPMTTGDIGVELA